MFNNRIGLIVWMHSLKQVRSLKKFGNIHYVSKRMRYAVIYCDADLCETTIKRLLSLPYVSHVEKSQRPFLKTSFEEKWDKAKEYDYKVKV